MTLRSSWLACVVLFGCARGAAEVPEYSADASPLAALPHEDASLPPSTPTVPGAVRDASVPDSQVEDASRELDSGAHDATALAPMLCGTGLLANENVVCSDCLNMSCCTQATACDGNAACRDFWNCKQRGQASCQPPSDQVLSVLPLVQALVSCAGGSCGGACPTETSM